MTAIMMHIPRTGGGSIEMAYQNMPGYQDLTYNPSKYLRSHLLNTNAKLILMGHHLPLELCHCGYDKAWVDGCFKFVFVRNPWDRLVSLFFYLGPFRLHRNKKNVWPNTLLRSFPDFVREVTDPNSPSLSRKPAGRSFWYTIPQTHWLIPDIDFIGRFESLEKDWEHLRKKINLPQVPFPHHNPSKHNHYSTYYDAELRNLVAVRYAEEIERFGYRFQEE